MSAAPDQIEGEAAAQVGRLRALMRAGTAARSGRWERASAGPGFSESRPSRPAVALQRLAGDLGFFTAGLAGWLLVGIVHIARRIRRTQ